MWRVRGLALALAAEIALFAVLMHLDFATRSLWLAVSSIPVFLLAVLLLAASRLEARAAALVVLGGAVVLQLVALTRGPLTSDDVFRYLWDAKVQLSGVDPYRFAPSAPELRGLRDSVLFGPSSRCTYPIAGSCTAINRPGVHTIYPPVAQVAFALVRLLSLGGRGGTLPYQLAAAAGAVAIGVVLVRRALRRGSAVWPVALWAWCPVVVSEFGNNAHIDWLGVLLAVLALQAVAANRDRLGGALLGAAIAIKIYPVLLLPALMRRRPWLVPLVALSVIVAGYLPHVLATGGAVIGFLPGYLHEEGYNSGARLLLLSRVLPRSLDTAAGLAILVAVAGWGWRRSPPNAPEQTAVVLVGAAFLVITPRYGWYAALLIALVVMSERWEWLPVAFAPTFVYLVRDEVTQSTTYAAGIYAAAGLMTAAGALLRTRTDPRRARSALRIGRGRRRAGHGGRRG